MNRTLILVFAALAVLAATAKPAIAACPVAINKLGVESIGTAHGYVRYQVRVAGDYDAVYDVRLTLKSSDSAVPKTVDAPKVRFRSPFGDGQANISFVYPSKSVNAVSVARVVALASGESTECNDSPQVVLSPGGATSATFDDSKVLFKASAPIMASVVVESSIVQAVAPIYLESAREGGITGSAIVEVSVGPGGKVVNAIIYRSSGNLSLNNAALNAARSSVYTEPTIDGAPAVASYLIEYVFRLQ